MPKRDLRKTQRDIYRTNIKKLQRAGLIGDVDFRKKATPAIVKRLEKYRAVLIGKAAVVKAPDAKAAARLRKTLGLSGVGRTIIVPKEKNEKYSLQKSGEIVSTRKGYNQGEIIKKTLSKSYPPPLPPGSNKRLYYTIPAGTPGVSRLKRKTFGSHDEFLYYLSEYNITQDDIIDRVEIEEIIKGGRTDKRKQKKIYEERAAAQKRYARAKRRKAKATRK